MNHNIRLPSSNRNPRTDGIVCWRSHWWKMG